MLKPAEREFADALLAYFAGLRRRVVEALKGQPAATPARGVIKAAGASGDHPYEYSTAQIVLPDDVADRIRHWATQAIPDADVYTDPTLGRVDVLHVTVRYGLLTNDAGNVAHLIQQAGIEPFEMTLGKTSTFDGEHYDVLKLDVYGNRLFMLNELLGEHLTSMDTHTDYRPHVTLAYLKKGRGEHYAGACDFDGVRVPVERIQFVSSEGREVEIPLE